ncbi:MAG: cytochrome c [Ignavibacteriaceae bacterium]
MSDFQDNLKDKLEDLKKNPGKIFGLLYPYIFIVILILGLIYMANLNQIARQTIPPALPDTTAPEQLKIEEPRQVAAVDVNELSKPTDEMVSKGMALYQSNCASCHGTDGKGDGPASQGLNPPPRNYTIKTGWVNGQKISQIYETLENGINGSAMRSFDYLSPEDKFALAHYIRKTFIPDPPEDSKSDLQNLEQTYNLSKARTVPGQVPIEIAMDLIIKENQGKAEKVKKTIEEISEDQSDGAVIFKKVTKNQDLVITSLINSQVWKNNKDKFVSLVVDNVNQDGFNDQIFSLNDAQWNLFYNYMNRIL